MAFELEFAGCMKFDGNRDLRLFCICWISRLPRLSVFLQLSCFERDIWMKNTGHAPAAEGSET